MPGLDPGIHVRLLHEKAVDGRVKPGHDVKGKPVLFGIPGHDTRMPYVIIFGALLFVGLVASCVLTVSGP